MGKAIKTGRNYSGYSTLLGPSTPPIPPPVNTVAPVMSFAGGDNSVGILATTTDGTWTGAPTFAYDWRTVTGGTIGAANLNTYTPTSGIAGLALFCRITGTNGGGFATADSNQITVKPYWSVNPIIAGGNWPGGTMTATPGTVAGATSQSAEWEVNAVGTGDVDVTYVPIAADVGFNATYVEEGTNAGGSTTATSNSVAIVQVDGITRAAEADDFLTRSTVTMTTACTLLVEYIGFSASAGGLAISWGRQPGGAATRREIAIRITSAGNLQGLLRNSTNLGVQQLSPADLLDGSTRHILGFDQDQASSTARLVHMIPFGAVTSTTAFASGGYQDPGTGTVNQFPTLFRRQVDLVTGGLSVDNLAACINVAVLDRKLAVTDYDDIAAAGSLLAWGAYTDPDTIYYIRPAADQVEGTAITAMAQMIGSTWNIQAGAADLTIGGLNVPV